MTEVRRIKIKSNLSLTLCIIDSYTMRAPIGLVEVRLEGILQKPIVKQEGFYIFSQLPKNESYKATITSDFYFPETIEINLTSSEKYALVYTSLIPYPAYPFGQGATLLRTTVNNSNGQAAANADVQVTVTSDTCIRAKLAQDIDASNKSYIHLTQIAGHVCRGDLFLIKATESENNEYCSILNTMESSRHFQLNKALEFEHKRGSSLLPVIKTKSDTKGEIVVPFRNYRVKDFNASVEIRYNNQSYVKEVSIGEGMVNQVGLLSI